MDEDYGEYVFALTQAVSALKDDRAMPVLVGAISRSGVDLLQYGDKALEPLLAQLKNPNDLTSAKALEVALAILKVKNDAATVRTLCRAAVPQRRWVYLMDASSVVNAKSLPTDESRETTRIWPQLSALIDL
jgi:hypothetical protein